MNPLWRNLMMTGLVAMLAWFITGCEPGQTCMQAEAQPKEVVVNITAGEGYFDPDVIMVNQGQEVTVEIENVTNTEHTFTIDEFDVDVSLTPGTREEVTFTVTEEGTFEFYCALFGHRDDGMHGELVVGNEPNLPGGHDWRDDERNYYRYR